MPERWPALPYETWKDSRDTLHLWTQIVGKVKLELSPFLNHWWNVGLQLTARGLSTGPLPWRDESFDIEFDFIDHRLIIRMSDGQVAEMTLAPRSVADFYHLFMETLASLGVDVRITTMPAEIPGGIRFDQDSVHATYDAMSVQHWWRILLGVERLMQRYRVPFHGKSSEVLFFWGGFDLTVVRYNGQPAPLLTESGRIMEYAEDQENIAVGFWSGADQFPHAAFYAYRNPALENVATARIQPDTAQYDATLGEFILRYDDVRNAAAPEDAIVTFFQTAYEELAGMANWERHTLEGHVPDPYQRTN